MLSIRDKIVVLFATAPEGFAASQQDLRRKFGASRTIYPTIRMLKRREILVQDERGQLRVGPALVEELK